MNDQMNAWMKYAVALAPSLAWMLYGAGRRSRDQRWAENLRHQQLLYSNFAIRKARNVERAAAFLKYMHSR